MFAVVLSAAVGQFFGQPGIPLSATPPHNLAVSGLRIGTDEAWPTFMGPDPSRLRYDPSVGMLVADQYRIRWDDDDLIIVQIQAAVPLSGASLSTRSRWSRVDYPAAPNPYPAARNWRDWTPWQDAGPPDVRDRYYSDEEGRWVARAKWLNTPAGHVEALNESP